MTETAPSVRSFELGWHLVGFLDVLGQREKFRELVIPRTPDEHARVHQVLMETAGFVWDLRSLFQKHFDAFEAGVAKSVPGAQKLFQPKFIGFSDSLIVSVPLKFEEPHVRRIMTAFSALSAASSITLYCLAQGQPLRGGIDVGLGTELAPGEIYGTALERPYLLECRQADYARVVIGKELWSYLSVELQEAKKLPIPFLSQIIEKELKLITVDADGHRILDFLGAMHADVRKPQHVDNLVRPAYQFVRDEQQHWLSMGNSKLAGRYSMLRQYFELRLPLWGVAIVK